MIIETLIDCLLDKPSNSLGQRVIYAAALDPADAEKFKWVLPGQYQENKKSAWRYTCSDRQLAILMIAVIFRKKMYQTGYPKSWKNFLKDW
jgi:hypothetical protein